MSKANLLQINPRDYDGTVLLREEILSWFEQEDAFWVYQGDPSPEKAHAELASGLCSNGYFDVPRVLKYPNIAEILGRQLGRLLKQEPVAKEVNWVVSSAYSAIVFGHEVAKELGVIFMNTEKDPADAKKQLWQRQTIPLGSVVLDVEELVTTTQTLLAVRRAVTEGNANEVKFLDIAGAGILRPAKLLSDYDGIKIVSLVPTEIQNFKPEECPYCKAGSPRYKPKTHWKELTGKG